MTIEDGGVTGPCWVLAECPLPPSERSRYLSIVPDGATPALPYVLGNRFRPAAGGRVYRVVTDDDDCPDSLLRSPDGRYLMYGSSRGGWPVLDVLDLRTGARFTWRARACDPAWGRDGQIAYVHFVSFNANSGGVERVVVQHGLDGTPRAWTRLGSWAGPVWAGNDLLANDGAGLFVLYGPGREEAVDGDRSELGLSVVALSPHGTEALLDAQRLGPGGGGEGPEDLATLLRVDDDRVLSSLVISRNESGPVAALAPGGDWQGDEVVTTDGYFSGGAMSPPPVLVTLTVTGGRVRERSIRLFVERGYSQVGGQDKAEVSQATFLDASGRHVAMWLGAIGQLRYVACDTITGNCSASWNYGDPYSGPGANGGFVSNPSRP